MFSYPTLPTFRDTLTIMTCLLYWLAMGQKYKDCYLYFLLLLIISIDFIIPNIISINFKDMTEFEDLVKP